MGTQPERLAGALSAIRHLRGPRAPYQHDGEPVTETTLRTWMERAERAAGPPCHGPHSPAAAHALLALAMRGPPAKAIQELAGHAHLSTTMRCMHPSPAPLKQAIRLLDCSRTPTPHARQRAGRNRETGPCLREKPEESERDKWRPHRDSKFIRPFHRTRR